MKVSKQIHCILQRTYIMLKIGIHYLLNMPFKMNGYSFISLVIRA